MSMNSEFVPDIHPTAMFGDPKQSDIDPAVVFKDVATIADLAHALIIFKNGCADRHARRLDFIACMGEQAATKLRLAQEFGDGGEKLLARFANSHPDLLARAELANVAVSPEFALAAVRAYRASLNR